MAQRIGAIIVAVLCLVVFAAAAMEAPEGVVYCGGAPERQIEFIIRPSAGEEWNVTMSVAGDTVRAMSIYSYFGRQKPPEGFVVALLDEQGNEYFVFEFNGEYWLEFEQTRFDQCN